MKHTIFILLCFCSLGGTSICEIDETAIDVRLEIRTKETILKKGTPPNIEVYLMNKGDKLVNLVQPGDGSESGWRTPMVKWSTRIVELKSVPQERYADSQTHLVSFPLWFGAGARCGNVEGLKRDQIISILPRQEVNLKVFWNWRAPELRGMEGKYGVKFFYENKPDIVWKGAGYNDPDALEIVRTKTAAVQLESNELIFEVVE
ncbi:MAG: hypothetical protein IT258_23115 [Saprospiraceae bacterium]|nr:hypothetical protein [Saprospiraceae bacterium]